MSAGDSQEAKAVPNQGRGWAMCMQRSPRDPQFDCMGRAAGPRPIHGGAQGLDGADTGRNGMFSMKELEAYVKDLHWVSEKIMLVSEKNMMMLDEMHQDHLRVKIQTEGTPQKEQRISSTVDEHVMHQIINQSVTAAVTEVESARQTKALAPMPVLQKENTETRRSFTSALDTYCRENMDQTIRHSVFEAMRTIDNRLNEVAINMRTQGAQAQSSQMAIPNVDQTQTAGWVQLANMGEQMQLAFKESADSCRRVLEENSQRMRAQEVQLQQTAMLGASGMSERTLDPLVKKMDKLNSSVRSLRESVIKDLGRPVTPRTGGGGREEITAHTPHRIEGDQRMSNCSLDDAVAQLTSLVRALKDPVLQAVSVSPLPDYGTAKGRDQILSAGPMEEATSLAIGKNGTTPSEGAQLEDSDLSPEVKKEDKERKKSKKEIKEEKEQHEMEESGSISGGMLAARRKSVLDDEEEPTCFVEKLVGSAAFEMVFAMLIVFNTLNMCIEAEYRGIGTGHKMGIEGQAATNSGADNAFEIMDMTFTIIFTSEVVLKLIALRIKFWISAWNVFDFVVIALAWISTGADVELPINPMLLRLFRLVRLLRLLRALSAFEVFDNLLLMVRGIKASTPVLIWVILLVFPLLATCGLGFNYTLEDVMLDEARPMEDRMELYNYFGTFTNAVLTMFEVTFGNWVPVCRFLHGKVDQKFAVFFMLYQLTVGIAVLRIIYGVFLHVTFECATNDDQIVIAQKNRTDKRFADKMKAIFEKFDTGGEGELSREMFRELCKEPRVQTLLSAMELDINDSELVFDLADDGDGKMGLDEMVESFNKLKGSARSIDIVALTQLNRRTMERVDKWASQVDRDIRGLQLQKY